VSEESDWASIGDTMETVWMLERSEQHDRSIARSERKVKPDHLRHIRVRL
jgi:hypothetical protein